MHAARIPQVALYSVCVQRRATHNAAWWDVECVILVRTTEPIVGGRAELQGLGVHATFRKVDRAAGSACAMREWPLHVPCCARCGSALEVTELCGGAPTLTLRMRIIVTWNSPTWNDTVAVASQVDVFTILGSRGVDEPVVFGKSMPGICR